MLFLPLVFVAYWSITRYLKAQNLLLLLASYFFYAIWDYRFLSLIILSSIVDYLIGLKMYKTTDQKKRKSLLFLSLGVNLGFLFVFKYFNFFSGSLAELCQILGFEASVITLTLLLPVGISFYTFQTLSYTLDIYRGTLTPTKSALNFFTYVAFFPQLVAGPIERATDFLPQIEKPRFFNQVQARDGMQQILWGLFKKVVIADNAALIVNAIFQEQSGLSGPILWIGGLAFVMQIYCDFSGYSDIAIGTAKLLGINLTQNFNNPYFSTNTTELWRRWHISLSTWFRDYIFQPLLLSLRNWKKKAVYCSTIVTFFLIGLWHGGNWTFIFFGLLQALFLSIEIYTMKSRKRFKKKNKGVLGAYYFTSWILTMLFWLFVCIIFRSDTLSESFSYISKMFHGSSKTVYQSLEHLGVWNFELIVISFGSILLFVCEFISKEKEHSLKVLPKNTILRYAVYMILSLCIIQYLNQEVEFIYFQF